MVFGFLFKGAIYSLRKKYDRIREKADRLENRQKRIAVLKMLDQVEPTLIMLEERDISMIERNRMIRYVKSGIQNAKDVLNQKNAPQRY